MSKEKTTVAKIFEIRDRYFELREEIDSEANPDSDRNYLQQLMDIRKELSCLNMDLARETGKYLRDFKFFKGSHEAGRFIRQGQLMDEDNIKVTAAEAKAKQETAGGHQSLLQKEAIYASAKLILEQSNELLFSVKQDISIIKNDYDSLSDRD